MCLFSVCDPSVAETTFTSPNYPGDYPRDIDQTWRLSVDPSKRVAFQIDDFYLEFDNDYYGEYDYGYSYNAGTAHMIS